MGYCETCGSYCYDKDDYIACYECKVIVCYACFACCHICNYYKCSNCVNSYYIFPKSIMKRYYQNLICYLCRDVVGDLKYQHKIVKSTFKYKRSVLLVYEQVIGVNILKIAFIL